MRITHRKLERCKDIIEMKVPITELTISDPLYGKDVWCRYENSQFPAMEKMAIFLNTEHVDASECSFAYDNEEYIIRMVNHYALKDEPDEQKEYEIGVDTARYDIQTNHGYAEISTLADGSWGNVTEQYFNGKLGWIEIRLLTPDDAMSKEEFLKSIKAVFGIEQDIEFKIISDEDVDIEIRNDEHEISNGIEMK